MLILCQGCPGEIVLWDWSYGNFHWLRLTLLRDLGYGHLIVPGAMFGYEMWYPSGLPKHLAMMEKIMQQDYNVPVKLTSRECRTLLPLVSQQFQNKHNAVFDDFLACLRHAVNRKHTLLLD